MSKSREAWDLFHERVGTCMAHLSNTAGLMGQARQEPGAAAKVPPAVVSSLQGSLETLSRLQEESRLRSAAAARVASGVQRAGMGGGGAAGATGDDEEEGGNGGAGATGNTAEAVFLRSGGVEALHKTEKAQVEAKVAALNVQGLRRWKEVMEAMGEGGGDDDVEVEVEADAAALSTKCPVTGMDMVNPLRSRDCPHSYSLQGIVQHILVRNNAPASVRNAPPSLDLLGTSTAPCPVAGCTHLVGAASLEKDYDAEMRLRRSQVEAANAAAAAPGDFEEIDEA